MPELCRQDDRAWAATMRHRSAERKPVHAWVRTFFPISRKTTGYIWDVHAWKGIRICCAGAWVQNVWEAVLPCSCKVWRPAILHSINWLLALHSMHQALSMQGCPATAAPAPWLAQPLQLAPLSSSRGCPGWARHCNHHHLHHREAGLTVEASKEARKEDSGMSRSTLLSMSGVAKYTALAMVVRHLPLICSPDTHFMTSSRACRMGFCQHATEVCAQAHCLCQYESACQCTPEKGLTRAAQPQGNAMENCQTAHDIWET